MSYQSWAFSKLRYPNHLFKSDKLPKSCEAYWPIWKTSRKHWDTLLLLRLQKSHQGPLISCFECPQVIRHFEHKWRHLFEFNSRQKDTVESPAKIGILARSLISHVSFDSKNRTSKSKTHRSKISYSMWNPSLVHHHSTKTQTTLIYLAFMWAISSCATIPLF